MRKKLRELHLEGSYSIKYDYGEIKSNVKRHTESLTFTVGKELLEELDEYNCPGNAYLNQKKYIRLGASGKHAQVLAPLSLEGKVHNQ